MTIYVNGESREVVYQLPAGLDNLSAAEINVFAKGGTESLAYSEQEPGDDHTFRFNLPFHLTRSDATYEVEYLFTYNENTTYELRERMVVEVVTPILPLSEINALVKEDEDWSEEDLAMLERSVRTIIQAHTGQSFGKYVGEKYVSGSGESNLRLPSRLISLNTINGNSYWNPSIAVRGGGWYLASRVYGVPSIRADYEGWHENPYTAEAPINHPYQSNTHVFVKHTEYTIDGVWGWSAVPEAVKEAARLLINDYACGDSNYRDRFLSSVTAADWRLQFHEGAFSNTGNVRANQLLAEYVLRRGWVVI